MAPIFPTSINVNGKLIDLSSPHVMGIINITPDSFFAGSRKQTEQEIIDRVRQINDEGGTFVDIGAYSSRPGAEHITQDEEMQRLRFALQLIRKEFPHIPISVDTFRADVAAMCVEEFGVGIINDISGGTLDKQMFEVMGRLRVPYILMHMKGTPQNMQEAPRYDHLVREVFMYFAEKIQQLRERGVNDIIVDPGFGFAKTLDHNYELMSCLSDFAMFELPILVGISRKSMITRLLGTDAAHALNGTTVLNTISLMSGAHILRVHDVKEAMEAVRIVSALRSNSLHSKHIK